VRKAQAKHCPLCGAELAPGPFEGRERLRCQRGHYVHFENPASAAAGIVVDSEGRVLLVRRRLEPHRGDWALPAGYQDDEEEPRATARREIREETGLEVEALELFDAVYMPPGERSAVNLLVYLCRVVGGRLEAGDDVLDARFFDLDELPDNVGFQNRERILSRLRGHRGYESARAKSRAAGVRGRGPLSYADAGVDIDKATEAIDRAKGAIRRSFTPGVLGDVGLFGGLFDLERAGAGRGILVASTDGVGTKLEVAKQAGVYHTLGRDLVQHCINDILVQGARPLFFLDYVAVGVLDPRVVGDLIGGCADACRENGLALLGGETAEMPGLYAPGDFDLAGFIVGVVEREALLDGSRVRPGQVLLGLGSSGLHTNGYSLARKVLFERLGLGLDARPRELGGKSLAEALLEPHRSYLPALWPLIEANRLAGLAHITGGGLLDNLPRILGRSDAVIDRTAWAVPPLFEFLVRGGEIEPQEAYRVFNMGIGMVLVVEPEQVDAVCADLEARGEPVVRLGETAEGTGVVRWRA
jgi:phosphoribosylformylglycinamidine cyclo-ligase